MDLYNYWLMDKVAEEDEQESFAERHKKKLVAGGILGAFGTAAAGGRLADYGGEQINPNLKKTRDRMDKRFKKVFLGRLKKLYRSSVSGGISNLEAYKIQNTADKIVNDAQKYRLIQDKISLSKRLMAGGKALGKKILRRGK